MESGHITNFHINLRYIYEVCSPPPLPDNPDNYLLYVEGSVLTSLKETDVTGEVIHNKVTRASSLTILMDNQALPGGCGVSHVTVT